MTEALGFFTLAFTSLLAIVNPVSAIPIFVGMTSAYERGQRAATLRRGIFTAFLVMVAFALLGALILQFFGITTPAFQIAGGIIFFGIGWDMLHARRSRVKTTEEEEMASVDQEDVGIIPLGIPSLAGPGAITTVIALQSQAGNVINRAAIYVSIVLVCLISWALLAAAPAVTRRMGSTGMNILTRLMGLLEIVVGTQFIINGVAAVAKDIL